MKRFILIMLCAGSSLSLLAQPGDEKKGDTIKVGGLIIITKKDKNKNSKDVTITNKKGRSWDDGRKKRRTSNVTNNWFSTDLGFANYKDETVYGTPAANSFLLPTGATTAPTQPDFKLRTGKSVNVNVWVFMQKLNMIKHVLNLKYGIGVELNNYRFKSPLSFKDEGNGFVIRDSVQFSKNKLAVDYVTVPVMLNINPSGRGGFSLSGGISVGYRYSARNKQISDSRGKEKERGEFGLNPFKLAVVGDIGWSSLRLYGSYSLTNLFEDKTGMNFTPYNVGLRFSSW